MSETKLEYQIDKQGIVINITATKSIPAYTLKVGQPLTELPIPRRGFKTDHWTPLKREVCHLPADSKWRPVPAEPDQFPNYTELRRAMMALKRSGDKFMESMLNGSKLEAVSDKMNLRLYVRVIPRVVIPIDDNEISI